MTTVTLDARHIDTVAALQRYIQFAFDFPDYYGRNLDALHDMLRTLDRPTRVVLLAGEAQDGEVARYLPRLARVIEDSARENARLTFGGVQRA